MRANKPKWLSKRDNAKTLKKIERVGPERFKLMLPATGIWLQLGGGIPEKENYSESFISDIADFYNKNCNVLINTLVCDSEMTLQNQPDDLTFT